MTNNIPKGRLSYSMWNLWRTNKTKFRQRYYENMLSFETRESIFGKKVAKIIEKNEVHPILIKVPRGTHPEYRIETTIADIPVLGFLDSFTPDTGSLFEFKTGRIPWNQERVDTHDQLPFYSALIFNKFGYYDPHVLLCWLETNLNARHEIIEGIDFVNDDERDKIVELTGRIEVFTRKITKENIASITDAILTAAREIEEDYSAYIISSSLGSVT